MHLHIDIETYSEAELKSVGAYKYIEDPAFEILLIAYAFDDAPVRIVDLASGDDLPEELILALQDPEAVKYAHNASFERNAFRGYGFDIPIEEWFCSMVKAAYCGLPLELDPLSKALELGEKGKLATGNALIRYFCKPCKPTKTNGGRTRNRPHHNLEKWDSFKMYCAQDVVSEREVVKKLECYKVPSFEKANYVLDQKINDRGIKVDLNFASNAVSIDSIRSGQLFARMVEITGIENPNSPAQLKKWLTEAMGKEITTLAQAEIPALIEEADSEAVKEALNLRLKLAKSSIKKYTTMLNCTCEDGRAYGLFRFYGANRTGRWAGRLIQMQNLPQNHLKELDLARETVARNDYGLLEMLYEDMSFTLSQLIRTAFIAPPHHVFGVADFSAIEARVIAWLAGEKWRMDVFNTHGKIYEASAAMMFNVPIEEVTKGSDLRQKGKVAELALGYQGSKGALRVMGAESMGLTEAEMGNIVTIWRKKNPNIKKLWKNLEDAAKQTLKTGKTVTMQNNTGTPLLHLGYDGQSLRVKLPSGRCLVYWQPSFTINKFGQESIRYRGLNQETKQWGWVDTYGGKLTENAVQAIARDLLAYSMLRLDTESFKIIMHVHDEVVCELITNIAEKELDRMCEIMGTPPPWALGLPLAADGYVTPYYKKD